MRTDFERAIESAKYAALPLPRTKTGPTTIIGFTNGHRVIARNQHSCLCYQLIAKSEWKDPARILRW